MNMTDVWNKLGECFQWSFGIMKPLGNNPNLFFWAIIIVLIGVWLRMQGKFNKEAKENNTLK